MRDLNENAGAVARFGIASACAAVRQINKDFDPFADNVVRAFAIEIDDKSHPARIVFILRVIKPLGLRGKRHASEYSFWHYHVNRI
jgi:hypothetical protein